MAVESLTVHGTRTPSSYIRPRASLFTNGTHVPAPISIDITTTNLTHAAEASFVISLQDLQTPYWFDPLDSALQKIPEVDIAVQVGFLSDTQTETDVPAMTERFRGMIIHVEMDMDRQRATLRARDYSALLANQQFSGKGWQNKRASDVVAELASAVGLASDVDPTDGPIGQYRQYEHKALGLSSKHRWQTAWDFCIAMQRLTGYDLWVDGKTLHFKKPVSSGDIVSLTWSPPSSDTPFPRSRVSNLRLDRDMILSKKISVTVRSWDAKQRTNHYATYPDHPAQYATPYEFAADPGTTPDRLSSIASQRYKEVMAHARVVTCDLHPQSTLTPRRPVRVHGTGTTFDQEYRVDHITFALSQQNCKMTATLRNRNGGEGNETQS